MAHNFVDQRDCWVVYDTGSGVVKAVHLRAPDPSFKIDRGCDMFRTRLTEWAIMNAHHLVVQHGRVKHSPALVGL